MSQARVEADVCKYCSATGCGDEIERIPTPECASAATCWCCHDAAPLYCQTVAVTLTAMQT